MILPPLHQLDRKNDGVQLLDLDTGVSTRCVEEV